MKNSIVYILTLFGYCIPYVFLAMYGDAQNRNMSLYGVMVIAMGILCWVTIKMKKFFIMVIGNALSCLTSCICIYLFQTEIWKWYFKPFEAVHLAITISIIAIVIQIVVWKDKIKKQN